MDLIAIKKWLEGLDPKFLEKVKKIYPEINRLKHYCTTTGKIEQVGKSNKYKVIKNCPELIQLKKLLDQMKIGGIQFIEEKEE